MIRAIVMIALTLAIAGCSSMHTQALPRDAAAYDVIGAANGVPADSDYFIGPLDVLSISVFQEPDLSFEKAAVDASGNLLYPLIGNVQARGKTATQVAREIADRLGQQYLRNPQVTVVVASSMSQKVTIEGQVVEPGVYDISGSTTLLEALARAKSPTRVAKLNEVVVFRFVNGRRTGAVFDVARIRDGRAQDPRLIGGDVVVVGFSSVKGAFRDFLTTAPFFNVFQNF